MYHFTFYLKFLRYALQDFILFNLCYLLWLISFLSISHIVIKVNQFRFCSPLLTVSRLIFLPSYLDVSVH